MKFRFTPEMFRSLDSLANNTSAIEANAALDEHLKGLVKVHSEIDQKTWTVFNGYCTTHTAVLFDIEELKPKECEHVALSQYGHKGKFSCNDCGKILEYKLVEV